MVGQWVRCLSALFILIVSANELIQLELISHTPGILSSMSYFVENPSECEWNQLSLPVMLAADSRRTMISCARKMWKTYVSKVCQESQCSSLKQIALKTQTKSSPAVENRVDPFATSMTCTARLCTLSDLFILRPNVVDCQYSITAVSEVNQTKCSLSRGGSGETRCPAFHIRQHSCQRKQCSKGGSSFEVVSSHHALHACRVHDNLDCSYDVYCWVPLKSHMHHSSERHVPSNVTADSSVSSHLVPNVTVSILLDYEHFEAIGVDIEIYSPLRFPLWHKEGMDMVVNSDLIEAEDLLVTSGHWSKPNGKVETISTSTSNITTTTTITSTASSMVDHGIWSSVPGAEHFEDWVWSSSGESEGLQGYQGSIYNLSSRVMMIGESHMRFNFDHLVYGTKWGEMYMNGLPKKHGRAEMNNIIYEPALFASHCMQLLDSVCDEALTQPQNRPTVVVFQTMSWDLTYWPPLRTIFQVNATVEVKGEKKEVVQLGSAWKLVEMVQLMKDRGCGKSVHLVFVTAPPYPHACKETLKDAAYSDHDCYDSAGLARNLYAIAAVNQFLIRELRRIQYPHMYIVDAFEILEPRLRFNETVGFAHYLYRESGQVFSTPGGLVVLEAIKRAVWASNKKF